jgi:hypothetical protein
MANGKYMNNIAIAGLVLEMDRMERQRRAGRTILRVIGKLAEDRGGKEIARLVKEAERALSRRRGRG